MPKPTQSPARPAEGAAIPDPKLPAKGKVSRLAGKTLWVNPKLNGANPRVDGAHGARFHAILAAAGTDGMTYEAFRAAVAADESIKGFSNHLKWELDRNFILIK